MALISSYLVTTKNLESFFNSLITAKAPTAFTHSFLQNLEFKSTNDRLYIALLKGLGFLDPAGVPTDRYYSFLDQSNSRKVLTEAIKEAYEDLFSVHKNAQDLTTQEVKNKLKTLTQGKNSDKVVGLMANTFKALVDYAEWTDTGKNIVKEAKKESKQSPIKPIITNSAEHEQTPPLNIPVNNEQVKPELHYNIQIHLPESRDPAVYDVLFTALKKHLF